MDFFLLKVFPAFLMAGALALIPFEIKSFRREQERGQPRLVKLTRRLLGSLVLMALALMVFFGEVPTGPAQPNSATMAQFQHWLIVLGLALFLMLLAGWDALDGVRHLRTYLDSVEQEEVQRIQEHLGRPVSNGKKAAAD